MGAKMHVSEIHPHKERVAGRMLVFDKFDRPGRNIVVNGFHALSGQRAGILDLLRPIRLGITVNNTPRAEFFPELGVLWIVTVLRLLLGIQVIEIAVKFIKTMIGGQGLRSSAMVGSLSCIPSSAPGIPTFNRPVRNPL
jgi:hypothetical protein